MKTRELPSNPKVLHHLHASEDNGVALFANTNGDDGLSVYASILECLAEFYKRDPVEKQVDQFSANLRKSLVIGK